MRPFAHSIRRKAVVVACIVACALGLESLTPPAMQPTARLLRGAIAVYQTTLGPIGGRGGIVCRFEPSCSAYAEGALAARGTIPGLWLVGRRLLRCGPWTQEGAVDPPPRPEPVAAASSRAHLR